MWNTAPNLWQTEETDTTADTSTSKAFHFSYKIRRSLKPLAASMQILSAVGGGDRYKQGAVEDPSILQPALKYLLCSPHAQQRQMGLPSKRLFLCPVCNKGKFKMSCSQPLCPPAVQHGITDRGDPLGPLGARVSAFLSEQGRQRHHPVLLQHLCTIKIFKPTDISGIRQMISADVDCQDCEQLTLFLTLPSVLFSNNSHGISEFCPPKCSENAQDTSQSDAQISWGFCLHEICNHYTISKHYAHVSKYKIY